MKLFFCNNQKKILAEGMTRLNKHPILHLHEKCSLLTRLADLWNFFFRELLPTLDAIFYRVKVCTK